MKVRTILWSIPWLIVFGFLAILLIAGCTEKIIEVPVEVVVRDTVNFFHVDTVFQDNTPAYLQIRLDNTQSVWYDRVTNASKKNWFMGRVNNPFTEPENYAFDLRELIWVRSDYYDSTTVYFLDDPQFGDWVLVDAPNDRFYLRNSISTIDPGGVAFVLSRNPFDRDSLRDAHGGFVWRGELSYKVNLKR